MTELIEEFKHFCNQEQDIILVHPKEIFDWINQNYISKQQILNLECLKEEKITKNIFSITQLESRNKIRNQIKNEIKKL